MKWGYARVSSTDGRQSLSLQLDALSSAGCDEIVTDQMSGVRDDRPGLNSLLDRLANGDVLVVWKIDRLGRSVSHLLNTVLSLQDRGVGFQSLTEAVDSRTPSGRFLLTVLGAMASMEREILIERTKAGIEAARLRGRIGGRPRAITDEQIATARQLLEDPRNSVASICRSLKIAKSSFYRIVKNSQP